MEKYILTIDQGTGSTRAIIFDIHGNVIAEENEEITSLYPKHGYVEQDALEIYSKTLGVCIEVLIKNHLTLNDILSVGITNQRETIVLWDKESKEPVYNAIVWQSNQSKDICDELIKNNYTQIIFEKTGLRINPYFSASKIKWIFDNYPNLKEKAKQGKILCGTIDSWLIYKLTDGKVHATDYTNASRTMLFNIHTLCWDDDLLKIFDIPKNILPKVCDSSGFFGFIDEKIFLQSGHKIPICGVAGDQQAALFGHGCFNKGDLKNTYGTGCFALMNIGNQPILSNSGLLTTIAYKIKGQICYALEGSVFVAGSAIKWLRDKLEIIKNSAESESKALKVKDNGGVYMVPTFSGMGTPYWDFNAQGAILGLSHDSNKYHIVRATLESIAFQSYDVIKTMKTETKLKIKQLEVDGGATQNNFLMQFQSDILNCPLILKNTPQITALGVAFLAMLGSNVYKDVSELQKLIQVKKIFYPQIDSCTRKNLNNNWKKAIRATRMFK